MNYLGGKKIHLTVGLVVTAVLLSLMASVAASAESTKYIRDNATGGDCTAIGSWDQYSLTCTLSSDLVFSGGNGIVIMSDGVTLDGNGYSLTGGGGYGAGCAVSIHGAVTIKNLTIRQFGYGIYTLSSNDDIIKGNSLENNDTGLKMSVSNDAQVFGNGFIDNGTQITVQGGTGNVYNLPAPVGGNYWSNWAQPDSDNDGFVDDPYIFTGGRDDLPLAGVAACVPGKPALALSFSQTYWFNNADYQTRRLSVDYLLDNQGAGDAFAVQVTGSIESNGVVLHTPLPAGVGDIAAGASGPFILKYIVPPGVMSFRSSLAVAAADDCGNGYSYP